MREGGWGWGSGDRGVDEDGDGDGDAGSGWVCGLVIGMGGVDGDGGEWMGMGSGWGEGMEMGGADGDDFGIYLWFGLTKITVLSYDRVLNAVQIQHFCCFFTEESRWYFDDFKDGQFRDEHGKASATVTSGTMRSNDGLLAVKTGQESVKITFPYDSCIFGVKDCPDGFTLACWINIEGTAGMHIYCRLLANAFFS